MTEAQVQQLIDAVEKHADALESISKDFELIRVAIVDSLKIGGAIWRIGTQGRTM